MLNQIIRNIPDVTKNLIILNVLFFLVTLVLESQGILWTDMLAIHYPSSPFFEPYQVVTHFFMHGDWAHLFFNMMGLVVFGSQLERIWGKKRYFIFYFVTAMGATLLHWVTEGFELYQLSGELFPEVSFTKMEYLVDGIQWAGGTGTERDYEIMKIYFGRSVGASGAIYGLLAASALLFPNNVIQMIFPPIAIKTKWLALILILGALFLAYQRNPEDNVGHVAHLGGALFGYIMIQIWKKDRSNFY